MTANSSVQYSFGYDNSGKVVHVADVYSSDGWLAPYSCIGCGSELIPKLGNIKAHHFSHKASSCSFESYIHKISKEVIKNSFLYSLHNHIPFNLKCHRPVICGINDCVDRSSSFDLDLTSIFDTVSIEAPYNGYVVDILLSSSTSGRVLAVEVMNTHQCTDKKTKSGFPIIELSIQNENQLELFYKYPVCIHEYNSFNFKQFNPLVVDTFSCTGCPGSYSFTVNIGGKPHIEGNYKGWRVSPFEPIFHRLYGLTRGFSRSLYHSLFFKGIMEATESGIKVNWIPKNGSIFNEFLDYLQEQGDRGMEVSKIYGYDDYINKSHNVRLFKRQLVRNETEALIRISKRRMAQVHPSSINWSRGSEWQGC